MRVGALKDQTWCLCVRVSNNIQEFHDIGTTAEILKDPSAENNTQQTHVIIFQALRKARNQTRLHTGTEKPTQSWIGDW